MLFKPTIGTALSGKIGGIVASHNAGGAYFRVLSIPTNPNTPQQMIVRAAVTSLTNQWVEGLTPAQRTAWEVYADNVKLTNRIGEQINVSGLAMFIRGNVIRLVGFQQVVLDGPTLFNLGSHSLPTLTNASEATQTLDLNFGTTLGFDAWAGETLGFMFVFISRPQNVTVNYFKGPYRLAAVIVGDAAPPVSPDTVTAPFPFVEGQKLFGRAVTVRFDGRTSAPSFFETTAVA